MARYLLSEPEAATLPFLFKIGDQVRVKTSSATGKIVEGFFHGEKDGSSYNIVYKVKVGDDLFINVPEIGLEKLPSS